MDGYQHRSSDDALIAAAVRQTDGLRAASGDDSAGRPLHQRFARPSDRSLPYESLSGYEFSGARFRGGQGEVFEAIHTATRRRVAVKFLHDAQIADDGARRARFLREIEILAQLRHPNVVAIHTSDEVDGRTFYVMDFVAGAPLDRCLQREQERAAPAPRLRDETIVALFRQICDGVQAAHVRGVIHRDLKPANVLVDEFGVPRVVDFGLAKLLNDDSAHQMTAMTETGQFVGSLPWSSPEQVGGAHDALDTRSDVYSLGVMLYNALTGRHPYSLQGPMQEILRRIQSEPPTPIDHYRPDLPDDLATIVAKCLSKEPARRYQTAGELGRDLERYLADEPIEAKRDSTRYLLGKMLARHRVPLAAATAFLLVIVTASIVSLSLWRQAVVARDEAVSARKVADNRFDEVRALAHTFVFELDDQIRELPGSTTARLWATSTALDYLDRLAADARADASLRTELGQGYRRVGQILGQPGHANLGKFDDAYVSLTKGRDLLRDVAQSDPLNTGAFRDWAAVEMSLGDVQRVRQQLEDARNHYLEYHNVAQRIWETTEAPRDHREVASALLSLSDLAMAESRYDDALAQASTAADILHALPETGDYPQDLQRDRSVALTRVGDCEARLGHLENAEAAYRKSLALDEARFAGTPESATARRDVSVGSIRLAEMTAARGAYDEAMPFLVRSLTLREQALEADPVNAQAERDLATAYYSAGVLYANRADIVERSLDARRQDLSEARSFIQKALERWLAMKERGVLQKRDESAGDELRAGIAEVEQKIADLGRDDGASTSATQR